MEIEKDERIEKDEKKSMKITVKRRNNGKITVKFRIRKRMMNERKYGKRNNNHKW